MNTPNPLGLKDFDWQILLSILSRFSGRYFAYGSRVKGSNRPFSDIDLCCEGEIDLLSLQAEFRESDLSVKVDVTPKTRMSPEFIHRIQQEWIEISVNS